MRIQLLSEYKKKFRFSLCVFIIVKKTQKVEQLLMFFKTKSDEKYG